MSGMLLSCANMPVIKQIADLLGVVMSGIYFVFEKIGFANIGLCIIVFTLIVKLLMIPMSIKQQKTQKLSSLINPEIQAIQKKYRGKTGNDAALAMNQEVKAVYDKYGTSQTGGCLPMLLQMCILLALYGVVSAIPSHVGAVKDVYMEAATNVEDSMDEYNEIKIINQIMVDNEIEGFKKQSYYDKVMGAYYDEKSETKLNDIYVMLSDVYKRKNAGLNEDYDSWDDMRELKDISISVIESMKKVSDEDWKKIKETDISEYKLKLISKYEAFDDVKLNEIISTISDNYSAMDDKHNEVVDIYTFAGIDLSRSPSQEMSKAWWAILIPILSALTQFISSQLATKNQPSMDDNPMGSSLKMMNYTMPIMSAFICYSFASGLGLYWVVGGLFQIGQQIFVNNYFKNVEVDDIIKSNLEKLEKKRAKQGITSSGISNAANTNVRNIKVNDDTKNNTSKDTTYKKGGIAARANMVKEYNEKNNK